MTDYWKENNVASAFYAKRLPDRIYLGNQFCRLLFPKKEILLALLEKARSEEAWRDSFVCMPAGGQFKGSGTASGKPAKLVSEKRIDRDRRQ